MEQIAHHDAHMGRPKKGSTSGERDPFAVELGARIELAWQRAGFASRLAMFRASGLSDYNQLARWARGERVPEVRSLAQIARACSVSLDWLVHGTEESPHALAEWLEGPTGQSAPDDARAFLRSLPLHGYQPSTAFYDLAYQAWRHGLTRDLTPDEVSQLARDSARHT